MENNSSPDAKPWAFYWEKAWKRNNDYNKKHGRPILEFEEWDDWKLQVELSKRTPANTPAKKSGVRSGHPFMESEAWTHRLSVGMRTFHIQKIKNQYRKWERAGKKPF